MSFDALEWAFGPDTKRAKNGAKLVLLCLAHHHNKDTGQCNPCIARIGESTDLSRTAVFDGIKQLERLGYVSKDQNPGFKSSFRLNIATRPESVPVRNPHPSGIRTPPVRNPYPTRPESVPVTIRNSKGTLPPNPQGGKTPLTPVVDESLKASRTIQNPLPGIDTADGDKNAMAGAKRATGNGRGGTHDAFDEFWEAYPKKANKRKAENAWAKTMVSHAQSAGAELKPLEDLPNRIIADVKRRARSKDWTKNSGQYVPHPATYLNNRRWEDEDPRVAIDELEDAIATHPGNPDWVHHDSNTVTREQREDFANLKLKLKNTQTYV